MRFGNSDIRFGAGSLPPMIKSLLIANIGIFLLQYILPPVFIVYFGLVPALIRHNYFLWQFFTYMFLHGGFFHIAFNMLALYLFGSDIERAWGGKEFLKYYLICGVGAGVLNFVFSMNSQSPVIGASGAIYGILVAYALMFPDRLIYIYAIFPIKAKYLVIGFAAIEFFSSFVSRAQDGVAHFAHLGGMLIGYIYIKSDWRISNYVNKLKSVRGKFSSGVQTRKKRKEEDILDRVDSILDKINRVGYHNLTDEE